MKFFLFQATLEVDLSAFRNMERGRWVRMIAEGRKTLEQAASQFDVSIEEVQRWCDRSSDFRRLVAVRQARKAQMVPKPRKKRVRTRSARKKSEPKSRPQPKPRHPKRDEAVALVRGQGYSYAEAERATGVCVCTIRDWCIAEGVTPQPRAPHLKRAEAVEAVEAGMSKSKAARTFSVSRRTIDRWCDEAGVKSRFKRGQRFGPELAQKKNRAVALVQNEGLSYDAAGEAEGLSGETVRQECILRGIVSRFAHSESREQGIPAEHPQKERVIAMVRDERLTFAHVAQLEDLPESTIRGWCKENGVESPLAWNGGNS